MPWAAEEPVSILADLFGAWADTVARLCIGLRRLGTGGSFLFTPRPLPDALDIVHKFSYTRLGDSVVLRVLDERYCGAVQERYAEADFNANAMPASLVSELQLAEVDTEDREREVTGAVKLVTSWLRLTDWCC